MTYSVLIVDDHVATRARIRELVAGVLPNVVFGEVTNAQDACDLVKGVSWQLAVVDLQLPDRSGLAVIHAIVETRSATRIVAMSSLERESYEPLALRAGAHAYLEKEQISVRLPELLRARKTR